MAFLPLQVYDIKNIKKILSVEICYMGVIKSPYRTYESIEHKEHLAISILLSLSVKMC